MDAFQELGITAVPQDPRPRTRTRNVSEILTTIVAGTAITFAALTALIVVISLAFGAYALFLEKNKSPNDPCDPIIGCVP
jgi:hypothetical protein